MIITFFYDTSYKAGFCDGKIWDLASNKLYEIKFDGRCRWLGNPDHSIIDIFLKFPEYDVFDIYNNVHEFKVKQPQWYLDSDKIAKWEK